MNPADVHAPTDLDESAAAKIWAVYISEAEKYDKTLVEGWKSDMEGLLIFAGLFSASLTAFLVESYKTLSPDQGTITIAILAQISRQLEQGSNASAVDISQLQAVSPTSASLACNVLWFLSLGFSLSCALIATLLQQWSRDFVQSTEMRPNPVMRARIFAYLYFGFRRFGMHTMVQFIPLLLHVSLLLFFAGLVAFLHPIHTGLMAMAAALLSLISAAYAYLTILPMYASDSPYRTPMSNTAWGLFRRVHTLFFSGRKWSPMGANRKTSKRGAAIPTMVEIMIHDAVEKSAKRDIRDGRAILWTVRSLTDDAELESFVEALPDLIWGPNGRRRGYDDMINILLDTHDIRLVARIEALLRGCDGGALPPDLQTRRRISYLKALWAVACFTVSDGVRRKYFPAFDHALLASHLGSMNFVAPVRHHLISVYALVRWSGFCSLSSLIYTAIETLESVASSHPAPDPRPSLMGVQRRAEDLAHTEFNDRLIHLLSLDVPTMLQQSCDVLKSFNDSAYDILIDYLRSSAHLEEIPYEFAATSSMIQQFWGHPNSVAALKLKQTFIVLVDTHQAMLTNNSNVLPVDFGVVTVLYLLQTHADCLDPAFFRSLAVYVAQRNKTNIRSWRLFSRCDPKFIGSLLTQSLVTSRGNLTDTALYAIWASCYFPQTFPATYDEAALAAVSSAQQFFWSSCTVAVLKGHIAAGAATLTGSSDSASTAAEEWRTDWFAILVEFLECRDAFRVVGFSHAHTEAQTFETVVRARPVEGVSRAESLQRRFANSFLDIVTRESLQTHTELIDKMVQWIAWNSGAPAIQGFDDPNARETMLRVFITCSKAVAGQKLLLSSPQRMEGVIVQLASH